MKILFFIAIFPLLFSCSCKSQTNIVQDSSFTYYKDSLWEYRIDTCLNDLLRDIEDLDTNYQCFPPDKYYYDLTFEKKDGYRNISLMPSRWSKSMTLDFKGVIRFDQMSFLCRGDIDTDPIFTRTRKRIEVQLRKPKAYQFDSIDVKIESFTWNPTLAGKYFLCQGSPIDLYILVGKRLQYFSDGKIDK